MTILADIGDGGICGVIDRLAASDSGYECFAGGLAGPDDPRPSVPADALLDADMRGAVEGWFANRFESFDSRAAHSIWMKWYLNKFLPPFLLADILLMRTLPVSLGTVRFIVGEDARIAAVRVTGESLDTANAGAFGRFEDLIFDHFEPLIAIWDARTDVTRRVFWSNVGNTFEAMLRRVEAVSGRSERLDEAQALLAQPTWHDGRPNPLYDPVYYVSEAGALLRRRRILLSTIPLT